jgi:hypothetical protein
MEKLIHKGTSPATALANRENGRKSRGPITEQGKAMSCANAGKHWGRSEGIRKLMPALGESPAEFDQVRDGLYQALRPSDAFEEMLVDAMVDIHWRLARMIRGEAGAQGKRRRERKMKEEEIEATFQAGKFHDLAPSIVPTLGFVGLPDSPVKFRRILDCLRVLSDLVRYGGFQDEFADYLKKLYGHNPSERAKALMNVYDCGYQERDCGDPDRIAAHQAEFQEAIADEIAWFKKRAASHLQARAELRDPTIEAELVSRELDLGKVMLYQDYLERAFERKFKLLVSYRAMRAAGEDAGADVATDRGTSDAIVVRGT